MAGQSSSLTARKVTVTYYTTENDDSNSIRPMTEEESIEAYRQIIEEQPDALADLYIDFYDFVQIESLIFKHRLSAAMLIFNAASHGIDELMSKFEAKREDGSYLVSGWEAESNLVLSEAQGVTNDAYNLSIGATIVMAVAALESLLIDLIPDSEPKPRGLYRLLHAFLRRYGVPESQAAVITEMGKKLRDRRNTFAHSLNGSYWEIDPSVAAMFTSETMEDTLYTVGRLAVMIERIVLARAST
jgi:hypothetical protein